MTPKRIIKSDITLFKIIESLHDADNKGLKEIADEVGKSKASIHHHLSTMEEYGYVTNKKGRYRLTLEFFHIGTDLRKSFTLYRKGRQRILQLANEVTEPTWCMVEENGRGMFLDGHVPSASLNPLSVVGSWEYLHTTSGGKAILAYLSEDRVHEIIDQHGLPALTDSTITNEDRLFEELGKIRARGYALGIEENIEGINGVAVPVLVDDEKLLGAILTGGAANRLTREYCENELAPKVQAAADDIRINAKYE
jgi:DNA-binding IclR family transcriptional regulator